jgi:two-component system, cell cycle sensor histidine kinase PleC
MPTLYYLACFATDNRPKMTQFDKSSGLKQRQARDARVRASQKMKAARLKLTRGTATPELDYEMLAMFVRNERSAAPTIWALAIIFSLASMFWAPKAEATIWLIMVVLSKVGLLEVCRQFNMLDADEVDVRLWRRRFIFAELISGLTWAGFALIGVYNPVHNGCARHPHDVRQPGSYRALCRHDTDDDCGRRAADHGG